MSIFKSLRTQIIIFFLTVSLFSGLAISFTNYLESRKLLNARLNVELENSAGMIKKNIEENLADSSNMVLFLSQKAELKKFEVSKIETVSDNFIRFGDIFFNMYVFDRSGNLVVSRYLNINRRPAKPENLNDYHNVFTECAHLVYADGKPRFSETFTSKSGHLVKAFVAHPFS